MARLRVLMIPSPIAASTTGLKPAAPALMTRANIVRKRKMTTTTTKSGERSIATVKFGFR